MMRRDVDGANPASRNQLTQRADIQATIVDVHGQDLGAGGASTRPVAGGCSTATASPGRISARANSVSAIWLPRVTMIDAGSMQAPRAREHARELLAKASQPCRMIVREQ